MYLTLILDWCYITEQKTYDCRANSKIQSRYLHENTKKKGVFNGYSL